VTTGKALNGKPYAGNPHVRFDEGEAASTATSRRGSLLYKKTTVLILGMAAAGTAAAMQIVLPPECGEKAHRIAAKELARHWQEICGERLAIVPSATEAKSIRFAALPAAKDGLDAYRMKSDAAGLELAAVNGRSALYAVYDFLERRGGCRWFWDGDVVPKGAAPDIAGLDVLEHSSFEFRGLRYFAHRGLTRFQAEHWGLEDWKKEIDWCVKRRLNLVMPRIGMDDAFQKAYPDVVDYPDPAKPLPEAMPGFNNRSLFWSLQFRGLLRKSVLDYAFDRGLMVPEDFGTMSHWYSRTPWQFLDKVKPEFLPQEGGSWGHPTDRVWDVRDDKWLDAYWKLTEASISAYGKPDLLHTIGLGERLCYKDRAANLQMKIDMLKRLIAKAKSHYPNSRILLAGWDFYFTWNPPEVSKLISQLDPESTIIWDYEADATSSHKFSGKIEGVNNFTRWDVVGKFPYTFGLFIAYEKALDIRANYPVILERQRAIAGDPFCKGYIFWPESSHTDILLLRYFTANAWRADKMDIDAILSEFCRDRYGRQADAFAACWKDVIPLSRLVDWGTVGISAAVDGCPKRNDPAAWKKPFPAELACTPRLFKALAALDWEGDFVRRDAVDLARTAADRLISAARIKLLATYHSWKRGSRSCATAADVKAMADAYVALGRAFADLLSLHTDYSLYESYLRLDAVEKIRNPNFEHVLYENASCGYCRSHQYEVARWWAVPAMTDLANMLAERAAAGDKSPIPPLNQDRYRERSLLRPLAEMRPVIPRTPENWRRVLGDLAAAAGFFTTH